MPDDHCQTVTIGDYVCSCIPGYQAFAQSFYVLGFMDYGPGYTNRTALVGDENAHGMPVNVDHLTVLSRGHDVTAWRDRYLALYPPAKLTSEL